MGCSGKREVTGQVFVVTKGGENVKLGLVGIHVVGEGQLMEIGSKLLGEAQKAKAGEVLLLQLEAEVAALTSTVPGSKSGPLDRIREEAARRRTGIQGFSGGVLSRRFFQEMPPTMAQTDADGLFTVEAKPSDWLAARGERKAGGETENYLWLMPLKEGGKKLLVSNDRLLSDDDDLARVLAGICAGGSSAAAVDKELAGWVDSQRTAAKQAASEAKAKAEAMRARMASGGPFQAGEQLVVGLAVRWIPAGRFTMGSPGSEEERRTHETQHEVVLSQGFFIAETECTQGQWEMLMGSNPSNFKGANRPVEQVSWSDAVEYCRKLTVKQRGEGLLPVGWAWRLPTESEWEYAARGGTTGARYAELDAIAWHGGNSGNQTHPVKQKVANAWGLYDIMGNVWEWCSDWYGDYPSGSVTDPTGPSSGSSRVERVQRGGSWRTRGAWSARSAGRFSDRPDAGDVARGFRPALSSVR